MARLALTMLEIPAPRSSFLFFFLSALLFFMLNFHLSERANYGHSDRNERITSFQCILVSETNMLIVDLTAQLRRLNRNGKIRTGNNSSETHIFLKSMCFLIMITDQVPFPCHGQGGNQFWRWDQSSFFIKIFFSNVMFFLRIFLVIDLTKCQCHGHRHHCNDQLDGRSMAKGGE